MKQFEVTAVINRKDVKATVTAENTQRAREVGIRSISELLNYPLPWDEIVKIREC